MRKHLLALAVASASFTPVHAQDNVELDTVRVTATPTNQSQADIVQPTIVLTGEALDRQRAESLGDTLGQQPGVHNSSYGTAVGRPVIRGLGGARVKVLQSGLEAVDASSVSPDHAVAVHLHDAKQVEVLRGPASLLYGNGAFGGVVNVVDDRIPSTQEDDGVETNVRLGANSVNDGQEIALSNQGKSGAWRWHAAASESKAEEYRIPREAGEIEREENGEIERRDAEGKRLENSDVDHNRQFSLGGSYEFGNGNLVGIAVSHMDSEFGLPGHGHEDEHEEEGEEHDEEEGEEHGHEEEEGPARVDLESTRVDLAGLFNNPFAGAESLTVKLALTDYEHTEGHEEAHGEEEHDEDEEHEEGEEHEEEHGPTTFKNKSQDLRVELVLEEMLGMTHVVGSQISYSEFSAEGEEALVPSTDTENLGLFWLGEKQIDDLTLNVGARFDSISHDPDNPGELDSACGFSAADVDKTDFSNHSVSLGLIQELSDGWQVAGSVTSAQRAPAAEELFSCGAHEATLSYDIGNPDLDEEQALNLDISVRKNSGALTGSLSIYRNQVDDFIFQNAVVEGGELLVEDGLQAYRFEQDEVTLTGVELQLAYQLNDAFELTALADGVRGKLDNDDYLPRMPADRFGLGVNFESAGWSAYAQHMFVAKQDRTATFGVDDQGAEIEEIETDSYQLLTAGVGYLITTQSAEYRIDLQGNNLLNEEVRYHTSFVKDLTPQPGRGFKLAFNARF
ncbi:TonB-dependent receptor [Bacterioplanoides sp.]|uniref:TonB-dependent receptor n=1 Tax=Bacterioplanoides sp. TaxID=2066072 RepID=UPI003AFFE85C